MITADYHKEPWKHPSVWKSHIVTDTQQYLTGIQSRVATCECGWAACARFSLGERGKKDLERAINAHWHGVIAEASAARPMEAAAS